MKNNKIICSVCLKEKSKQYFCLDGSGECIKCATGESYIHRLKIVEKKVKVIEKIQKQSSKKTYPKEFILKRRKLLDDARKHKGCTACGSRELLQVHHIDVDIFNNDDSNLLVLCYYCHAKEHKHIQGKKPPKFLSK